MEYAQYLNSANSTSLKTIQGVNGGTYACKELLIDYAAWLSVEVKDVVYKFFIENNMKAYMTKQDTFIANNKLAISNIEMAHAFGFTGNQALLSADKATKTLTGYSPLALMGQTQLISDNKDIHMTVTELGSELNLKASEFNKLLRDKGFQEKIGMVMGKKGKLVGGHWKPTDKALGYSEYLDTGKRHSDGTPVKQIKWYSSILPELK